jgi:hypothetical protein
MTNGIVTKLDAQIIELRALHEEIGRNSSVRPSHPVQLAAWEATHNYPTVKEEVGGSLRQGNGQKIVIKNAGKNNTFNFYNSERGNNNVVNGFGSDVIPQ